jgi:hypothetical protein
LSRWAELVRDVALRRPMKRNPSQSWFSPNVVLLAQANLAAMTLEVSMALPTIDPLRDALPMVLALVWVLTRPETILDCRSQIFQDGWSYLLLLIVTYLSRYVKLHLSFKLLFPRLNFETLELLRHDLSPFEVSYFVLSNINWLANSVIINSSRHRLIKPIHRVGLPVCLEIGWRVKSDKLV